MKNHLIRLFLYSCIALIPIGCGTRKSATKILKNAEVIKVEEKSEVAVKKSEVKTEAIKEATKAENIDEDKSVTVIELYNEQGVIKSRTVTINTNKKSNNTTSDKESLKTAKNELDSVGKKMVKAEAKKETKVKEKTVTTDRNGLYWMLGIIGVIWLAFWLKPWVK